MSTEIASFSLGSSDDSPAKQAILHEGLRLFVRDGLCETSLRDIAEATGYSNTVLYKFFESKDALAIHIFEQCYNALIQGVSNSFSSRHSFSEDLEALVESYVQFLDRSLDSVLYVHENLRFFWPQVDKKTRSVPLIGLLANWIGKGKMEGVINSDESTDLLVSLVVGFLGQFARMLYFQECEPPAFHWKKEIGELLSKALIGKGKQSDG